MQDSDEEDGGFDSPGSVKLLEPVGQSSNDGGQVLDDQPGTGSTGTFPYTRFPKSNN